MYNKNTNEINNFDVNKNIYSNPIEILEDKLIFNEFFNEPLYPFIKILILKDIIVFGSEFNQNLSMLPSNVSKIYLGRNFQKSIIDISSSVKSIIFANDSLFIGSLDYLHNDLEELVIGDNYNIPINKLPYNLETLVLGRNFDPKIFSFSQNLKYLDIGKSYTHSLNNLPDNLETLIIGGKYNSQIIYPNNLKHFIISEDSEFTLELKDLPNSLVYLSIQNNYTQQISNLPESLLCLVLGDYYNGNITRFPNNLKKIKLTVNFNYDFIYLPSSLEIIELYSQYKYIDFLIYKFPNIRLIVC